MRHGSSSDDGKAPPLGRLIEEGLASLSGRGSGRPRIRAERGPARRYGTPPSAKSWKGEGPGVFELVEEHRGDAFRAVYTVRFEEAIYVLHCFQKKSPSGVRTAKQDVVLIHERLTMAQKDYEVRYARKED